jgi:hypothetical protein
MIPLNKGPGGKMPSLGTSARYSPKGKQRGSRGIGFPDHDGSGRKESPNPNHNTPRLFEAAG